MDNSVLRTRIEPVIGISIIALISVIMMVALLRGIGDLREFADETQKRSDLVRRQAPER